MKRTMVLVWLLGVRMEIGSVISSPNDRFDSTSVGDSQSSSTVHNVTIDCGDWDVRIKIAWRCHKDLLQLASYGYPWHPRLDSQRNSRLNMNAIDRNKTMRDALDSLNHVCHVYDRSQKCLEDSDIRDYCMAVTPIGVLAHIDFQFLCHHQQRDENLVRSLQCLYDKRLLVMLYFHIADRCHGVGILDDIMRRYKNALFYIWDINPYSEQTVVPRSLRCIPRSVIATCIRGIIEDHCGTMTADLVENYLVYLQDWFGQALQSAGLSSNICDSDMSSDMVPNRLHLPSGHTKLGISNLSEIAAPGTALDTVSGKSMLSYVQSMSGTDLCTTVNAHLAYLTCLMSADDRSEKSKFNILQFAHHVLELPYHGTQCSRLEDFTACWNLLQQICGPKVRGLEQHATLMVEGCNIQSELDTVGCHWQDMLLPHYIQASRVTVWPLNTQCLINPMFLDTGHYPLSFNGGMDELDNVISLLQPGVEEISRKCAQRPAKRLRSLLNKLHYLQRDAERYRNFIAKALTPN